MRAHCIMHVPFEGPGLIEDWFRLKKIDLKIWHLYEDVLLPDPDEIDFLLIMGGPMNIYEHELYPWLSAEKRLLRDCLALGVKMLGICLGAQLLADTCGSMIKRCSEREIGWFPISINKAIQSHTLFRDMPDIINAFHWHGETFDIPKDSIRIGSSDNCRNQGFLFNDHVLGLQFHLEITPRLLEGLIINGSHELKKADFVQTADEMSAGLSNQNTNRELLFGLLDKLLKQ